MSSDTESEEDEYGPINIVIDNGSGMIKAGFAGDDAPRAVFPTMLGRPKHKVFVGMSKDVVVGDEAQCKRGILSLSYPIERGFVQDWDNIDKIWQHTFYNELRVYPEEHKVLLTDSTMIAEDREKMTQIMFETFNVPGLYISLQAVLSLYATGRTNGIVLDSGYGVTNIVPIYEGHAIPHAIERLEFGGKEITEYMMKILSERGYSFYTRAQHEIVNESKEKFCYVALDFDEDLKAFDENRSLEKRYELCGGEVFSFGNEQIRAPEVLFHPNLLGLDISGIHHSVHKSITKCATEVQIEEMLSNIVLSGGNSMFSGIDERLKKELKKLTDPDMAVAKVIASPERKYHAWKGGSLYASENTMTNKWITKVEYDETGPSIIRQTCT